MNARVTGLRGLEFSVFDLNESAEFYKKAWALEEVARVDNTVYLRGAGVEHHILTLHEGKRAGLAAVNFAAPDRYAVQALHERATERARSACYENVLVREHQSFASGSIHN